MAKSQIYVGLEIGTTKICIAVGESQGDGALRILGVAQIPSRGVERGEIKDFEAVEACLQDALLRAEDISDVMIRNVYLSVTGEHIEGINHSGTHKIPEDQPEITQQDINEVKEIARDVDIPQTNVFLHSIVRHYYIDGQRTLDPLRKEADALEADYHIVHAMRNRIQNAIGCVRGVPLEVEDVVYAPIASAQVMLGAEAKAGGALLIDIGGGTTEYILYSDGAIAMSGCIPLGGERITMDIAEIIKIPMPQAEILKVREGSVNPADLERETEFEVPADENFGGRTVDGSLLNKIIHSRVEEIFEIIGRELTANATLADARSGLYLTGGTSLLRGIDELAEQQLELPVHRSAARRGSGVTSTFENPQFSTPIGLIRYAQLVDRERGANSKFDWFRQHLGGLFGRGENLTD